MINSEVECCKVKWEECQLKHEGLMINPKEYEKKRSRMVKDPINHPELQVASERKQRAGSSGGVWLHTQHCVIRGVTLICTSPETSMTLSCGRSFFGMSH
ncbi:hypothetical protein scyTo_0002032 [Scyliorhinus torazame]|uniref:Uncharacterized protein n=1 Tax=Scyliorhinus torazame TaxID=75743 RepID=A0A401PHB9_SCYTO|nr:hypothetical protein [Scyliorhinus torazame]